MCHSRLPSTIPTPPGGTGTERSAIDQYFVDHVLGPSQGLDPYYDTYPVFTPDYAAFYTLMSPEDLRSFTGFTRSRSKTSDDTLRAQVTNSSLFSMKGGDAGIALAAEAGRQEWRYVPDPRLMSGDIWGTTSVDGGRDRPSGSTSAENTAMSRSPSTVGRIPSSGMPPAVAGRERICAIVDLFLSSDRRASSHGECAITSMGQNHEEVNEPWTASTNY